MKKDPTYNIAKNELSVEKQHMLFKFTYHENAPSKIQVQYYVLCKIQFILLILIHVNVIQTTKLIYVVLCQD